LIITTGSHSYTVFTPSVTEVLESGTWNTCPVVFYCRQDSGTCAVYSCVYVLLLIGRWWTGAVS